MAYEFIAARKLIVTYGGHDYTYAPYAVPNCAVTGGKDWIIANIMNSTRKVYVGTSGTEPMWSQILASVSNFLPNIKGIIDTLSVNGEIHFWREDVGRNVAFVIRKTGSTNTISFYSYLYGTYTTLGTTNIEHSTYTHPFEDSCYLGFVYNPANQRYTYYIVMMAPINSDGTRVEMQLVTFGFQSTASAALAILFTGNAPLPPPASDEPYGDDTYDESVGGDGDHNIESDTIAQSALPIAAATRSGMVTAFVPNWGEIQDVADALLDPNIFQILAANVVKFSDVIIGLSVFPCSIPATDTATVTANCLGVNIGTGVIAHVADNQYVEIDCGSLTINEFWGNCMDYNPYTKISIFLPFCGMYDLDADEVMGKTLAVSYRVDIFSGACLATIKIGGSVFYQFSGQCSAQIPISSVSFDGFLASMLEIGVATATGVGAIGAAGAAVSQAKGEFGVAKQKGAISASKNVVETVDNYNKVKEESGEALADATAGAVVGSKGFYSHAGAMAGSPGFLGVRTPFLIIKRPEQMIPGMYGKFHGFPTYTKATLSDLVGYTEVSDIRLNIPEATVDEIIECEQLLKGGVVI